MNLRRICGVFLLITASLWAQACGGGISFQKAAEVAKDLNGATLDVTRKVTEVWNRPSHGGLTLEQKDRMADALIAIGEGGLAAANTLQALYDEFGGDTKNVPEVRWAVISRIFSERITAPFLNLLVEIGKISASQSTSIVLALTGLRALILSLSNVFGRPVAKMVRKGLETRENALLQPATIAVLRMEAV